MLPLSLLTRIQIPSIDQDWGYGTMGFYLHIIFSFSLPNHTKAHLQGPYRLERFLAKAITLLVLTLVNL